MSNIEKISELQTQTRKQVIFKLTNKRGILENSILNFVNNIGLRMQTATQDDARHSLSPSEIDIHGSDTRLLTILGNNNHQCKMLEREVRRSFQPDF